ncbi:hypothetical protein C7974DRAFT_95093 [Boeremia exigua]|uniref:uncharacterized protein n=1 Tax=Boeremia exigua TaxID=749465 RepID=UPI001E8CB55A|nr:uncharacterized protein C7974DRAFT_95093 [Boeremia exigua]KAH6642091.1 hypothetical protein C7974DRAFT_95093 [Boeremia exigua]
MGAQNNNHAKVYQASQPTYYGHGGASRSEREQLISRMYSCLPWELRHHIHTFCVQSSYDNEIIVRYGSKGKPMLLVRRSVGPGPYQWTEDPIILQFGPDKIGPEASADLLTTYYGSRTFKFAHQELGCIQSFLETDSSGLGIRPADHLRHLHLQIQPFMCVQIEEPELRRSEEARCCRALESLTALRAPRTTIAVHVDLTQGVSFEEEFGELSDDAAAFVFRILEIVKNLRVTGLNIEVILEGAWDERSGTKLCSSSTPSLDDCAMTMKIASR